jgi:hypothetical protein
MDILYNIINNDLYKIINREKCKKARVSIVSVLEKILNKTLNNSKKSIGITLRSFHICGPFILMMLLLVSKYRTLCNIVIFILFLIPILFILLDGCLLSSLENRFLNDDFNVIDPLLEMKNMSITKENRLKVNYISCLLYLFVGLIIYYYRFLA